MPWTDKTLHAGKDYEVKQLTTGEVYVKYRQPCFAGIKPTWTVATESATVNYFLKKAISEMAAERDERKPEARVG